MQQAEPGLLEALLRQVAWNLAGNASTIIVTLGATAMIALGPVGRGIGQLLATLRHKRDALHDPATTGALGDIAERLDFIERALVAVREPHPEQISTRALEPERPTPV